MLWGANAKDNADPVRVEKAFPAIITRAQFRRVGKHLSSRAPKFSHPRRVGSSYLLSGLAKCKTCNTPLIGRFAQSGKYSYYVCQSNIKLGRDACETPTLNARRFEELVVNKIRSNILTEGNIRDLVKGVAEEMDGVTREQRKRLETIEDELEEVKGKLGRIWHFIETSDAVMADASDRIREHRERQERLEYFAEQARAVLAQRRKVLDDVNTIAAYAKDMKDFLKESELTERRAFIQSFIKEIVVVPGDALLRYTVPMPDDSLIPGRAAEKVALPVPVLSTLPDGGPECTVLSPSHKANLPGAGNFGFPVSAGIMDLCAVYKALSPAVTHETVTMTRHKIMRRDFWDKLYCELFGGRSLCEPWPWVNPVTCQSTRERSSAREFAT